MQTTKIFSYNSPTLTFTRRVTYAPVQTNFSTHSHVHMEIVCCNAGGHAYTIDGETVYLTPGTLLAIAPGVPHRVIVSDTDYDRYSVIIHPSILPYGAMEEFKHVYTIRKLAPEDRILRHLKKAERYAAELPQEAQSALFPSLAIELYYMLVRSDLDEKKTPSEIVNNAIKYMDENYDSIKSISEVSDSLYISKSYFHALFKENVHMTPLAYLNERRLHVARLRILSGERPTAIFRECGFDDYTSFYRQYRARYGVSPSKISLPSELEDF